jgi:transcriptional regulator of acetoin/glycerol metabolism
MVAPGPGALPSTATSGLNGPSPPTPSGGRVRALAPPSTASHPKPAPAARTWDVPAGDVESGDAEVVAYERQRLIDALDEARGNKSEAARLLGMPRSTLCSRLKKHGMG